MIRRDNIGDLVCTTPLFTALRDRYPRAYLAALVNTYNEDVLDSHPVIDRVFAYEKGKHRANGRSLLRSYFDRLSLFRRLRKQHFDYAILAGPHYQGYSALLARMAGVAKVVGFSDVTPAKGIDVPVPYGKGEELHEVEDNFRLLAPFGIVGYPPAATVQPSLRAMDDARAEVVRLRGAGPLIALHISARKPSQRWPAVRFSELAKVLFERHQCRVMLLWSPGEHSNPRHPGDDEKVEEVASALGETEHIAYSTATVKSLIGALALCDLFIGADGGAMHLAAGLGKPVIALFGESAPSRWRPWGVASEVIQAPSRQVSDVSVEQVLSGYERLIGARVR